MRYTRKQLHEAIRYWQHRLDEMICLKNEPMIKAGTKVRKVIQILNSKGMEVDFEIEDRIRDLDSGLRSAEDIARIVMEEHGIHKDDQTQNSQISPMLQEFLNSHSLDEIKNDYEKEEQLFDDFANFMKQKGFFSWNSEYSDLRSELIKQLKKSKQQ